MTTAAAVEETGTDILGGETKALASQFGKVVGKIPRGDGPGRFAGHRAEKGPASSLAS